MNNFGATLLDVTQGMELAKQTQRNDEAWTRSQKRADMQDRVAQHGLDDLEQTRGDKARERAAVSGSDGTVKGAADAAAKARIASGDVAGAAKAKGIKLEDAMQDFQIAQTEFMTKILPQQQKLQQTQLEGQLRRQPGVENLADQDLAEKSQATQERMLARAWQVASVDKNAAVKLLSDSPILFQGKKITDIVKTKDGKSLVFGDEKGNPMLGPDGKPFMVSIGYLDQLATKYGDPGKVYEVEPGKRLVHATAGGKAKEIYAAPNAPEKSSDKFMPINEGTTGFFDPKTRTTIPVNGGQSGMKPANRNAAIAKVIDIVKTAKGGSLSMGLADADAQKVFAPIIARAGELVDKGMAPEAAANTVLAEFERAGNPALKGATESAAKALPMSWQDIAKQPFPTPRDAKPAGPNMSGSVMSGYGLETPEVPAIFP